MPSCITSWNRPKRDTTSTTPRQTPFPELTIPQLPTEEPSAEEATLTPRPSEPPSAVVDLRLPIEIWRRVFECARMEHRHTLAQLLRLHPALFATAEDVLYHTITLRTDDSVVELSRSMASGIRHRKLRVRELHVLTNIATSCAALSLACLLRLLPDLDYLTLGISGVWCPEPSWDLAHCVDILAVRFSHLRSFATSGPPLPSTERGIPHFLRQHNTFLRELDLSNARAPDRKQSAKSYERIFLPELRVLTCHPRMLREQLRVTKALRSVCLTEAGPSYLLDLSNIVGSHLVSLCLRNVVWAGVSREPGWTVANVIERFPRMKYLQIDSEMRPGSRAGISNYPIDWQAEPSVHAPHKTVASLTVVWLHESRGPYDTSPEWWTSLLDEAASRVLGIWGAYLGRISYRYGADGPFAMSVSWDERRQLVRAEDWNVEADSWKSVT